MVCLLTWLALHELFVTGLCMLIELTFFVRGQFDRDSRNLIDDSHKCANRICANHLESGRSRSAIDRSVGCAAIRHRVALS